MNKCFAVAAAGCLLLSGAGLARAGAGISGASILVQNTDARPAALAGAYAAVGGDLYSLDVNPAGLASLEGTQLMFMHLSGIEGLAIETLSGAAAVPGLGTIGAKFLYQGQPAIDNQVNEPAVDVKDWLIGLSFARAVAAGVAAGINLQMVNSTLGPANVSALVLDLGAQYDLDPVWHFGLAARHLGQGMKYEQAEDPLPQTFTMGAAWTPEAWGQHALILVADVDYLAPDQNVTARLGAEYWFKRLLAFRLGYAHSVATQVDGVTAGVGFSFKIGQVQMLLDYALRPQVWEESDFEIQNLLTLGAKF